MSERPVRVLLDDMLDAMARIETYTAGMDRRQFSGDAKTVDAVARNLEIIGEAANRLPTAFTARHAGIGWKKIVGLRHRIIHDYFSIDLDIVWEILQRDMPLLKTALNGIRDDAGT